MILIGILMWHQKRDIWVFQKSRLEKKRITARKYSNLHQLIQNKTML